MPVTKTHPADTTHEDEMLLSQWMDLKTVTYAKISPQNGELQRSSWGTRRTTECEDEGCNDNDDAGGCGGDADGKDAKVFLSGNSANTHRLRNTQVTLNVSPDRKVTVIRQANQRTASGGVSRKDLGPCYGYVPVYEKSFSLSLWRK